MQDTWDITHTWRAQIAERILEKFPDFEIKGEPFLSWLWIDTHSSELADILVDVSKKAGCPIRSGSPGYHLPTMVRVAVREPAHVDILLNAWEEVAGHLEGS